MLLFGAGAALVAARVLDIDELFILGSIAWVLIALTLLWVCRPQPVLTFTRTIHPPRPMAGTTVQVDLTVSSQGTKTSSPLYLIDQIAGRSRVRLLAGQLAPGAHATVSYLLPTSRRGTLLLGPLTAQITDPFGIAARNFRQDLSTNITVVPHFDLMESNWSQRFGDSLVEQVTRGYAARSHPADLATLRPYVVGDDMRRVHWPSSAHSGELVVRSDEPRTDQRLALVLDLQDWRYSENQAPFEKAVSAAATLVHSACIAGISLRLVAGDFDSGLKATLANETVLMDVLAQLCPEAQEQARVNLADQMASETARIIMLRSAQSLEHGDEGAIPNAVCIYFGSRPPSALGSELVIADDEDFLGSWQRHLNRSTPLERAFAESEPVT